MWINLMPEDILTRLAAPEASAVQTVVLATGQENPVAEVINEVSELVRGYTANAPRNLPLGSGTSIPYKLKGAAISLIVFRLCSRLPTKILATEQRRQLNDESLHLLERVAEARFAVDRPAPDQIDRVESIGTLYPSFSTMGRRPKFRDERGV